MIPFALPGTFVPGATKRIDPDTLAQELGRKGVPLWDMPDPVRYVEHVRRRRHRKTGKVITDMVSVPIYRGVSAKLANWYRSDARRQNRLSHAFAEARADAEFTAARMEAEKENANA